MRSAPEIREMWKDLRAQLVEECGRNEKKLAMAEVFALREIALKAAAARLKLDMQSTKRRKPFVR